MTLTLEDIKELISYMSQFKIDKLSFQGLVLTKSRHAEVITKTEEEDPLKTLVAATGDEVPEWLKGNEHMIFADPFKYPISNGKS